jgi:hypothetical protein
MKPLAKRLYAFLSQDIARQNAATAANRVLRERQQRAEVEAYLAQLDRTSPRPAANQSRSVAG